MAQKKQDDAYRTLMSELASGTPGRLYIFHGEERYLLEHSLTALRRTLCPDGLDSFNYRRFEGAALSVQMLEDAVNTLPAFAERTLVEVRDYDVFSNTQKGGEEQKQMLAESFAGLPDYVCLVFVYDTIPYKPDTRQKLNKRLLEHAAVIEFAVQEQVKLVKWITRHFQDAGKRVSSIDAEYLAFTTGGLMSALTGEIEKCAAYAKGETVTRADIDAVVDPVPDAVAYKLTDALTRGEYKTASGLLDELLRMREPAHKLMYSITQKQRQLLAARVCVENGRTSEELMELCGIRYPFQARNLLDTARKTTLAACRDALLLCTETAYRLNSEPEPEAKLIELVAALAFTGKAAMR